MRRLLLSLLRVPDRPEPPPGSDDTLDVFRSSRRSLQLGYLRWAGKQASALIGILISLAFLGAFDHLAQDGDLVEGTVELQAAGLSGLLGLSMMELLKLVEAVAIVGFVVQLVVTGLLVKLEWEMRWYMVTGTSLRIRQGLLRMREQTMTVANIQDMVVRQGPLQRLLGIADLEVRTAGGGGVSKDEEKSGEASSGLHVGRFRGIESAGALRDRLRRALARHRDAGLGDPDEEPEEDADDGHGEVLAAAERLLEETRRVRAVLESEA